MFFFVAAPSNNKSTNGTTNITFRKKVKPKVVESEPVILTLSSDDEDEENTKKTPSTEQLVQKVTESPTVTLSAIRKEPSINDIQQNNGPDTSAPEVKGKVSNWGMISKKLIQEIIFRGILIYYVFSLQNQFCLILS